MDSIAEAILSQEWPDMEVCFTVDSRSTDDSIERVEANLSRLPDSKMIVQKDGGALGAARNLGLDNTSGETVWFLDVDDIPAPDFLKTMVDAMDSTGADVVLCNYWNSSSMEIPEIPDRDYGVRVMDGREAVGARVRERIPITAWAKIQRRSLLEKEGIRFDDGISEDISFTYRELSKADRVAYVERPLYLHHIHPGSVSYGRNDARGKSEIAAYRRLMNEFPEGSEMGAIFRRRALLTAIRSMVHMNYPAFREEFKNGWAVPQMRSEGIDGPLVERIVLSMGPWMYYHVAGLFMTRWYYHDGMFDETAGGAGESWFSRKFRHRSRPGVPPVRGLRTCGRSDVIKCPPPMSATMRILVTGGAGYIGSVFSLRAMDSGNDVAVLDNFSTGHRDTLERLRRYGGTNYIGHDVGDILSFDTCIRALDRFRPDAVVHFAAFSQVAESMRDPGRYYRNNVAGTMSLMDAITSFRDIPLVFSSTAAVYGEPESIPMAEDHPLKPINPYGNTKLAIERMMDDYDRAKGLRTVRLRYFNVAGADSENRVGEMHDPETHLIPNILGSALPGNDRTFSVFGTDYPTRDGTCVRDYVNVEDLADAHLLALKYLLDGGETDVFNLGTSEGSTVREVFEECRRTVGRDIPLTEEPRRPGDPAVLVADNAKAGRVLGWKPRHTLADSVRTAWEWERSGKGTRRSGPPAPELQSGIHRTKDRQREEDGEIPGYPHLQYHPAGLQTRFRIQHHIGTHHYVRHQGDADDQPHVCDCPEYEPLAGPGLEHPPQESQGDVCQERGRRHKHAGCDRTDRYVGVRECLGHRNTHDGRHD